MAKSTTAVAARPHAADRAGMNTRQLQAADEHRAVNQQRASILATVASRFGMDPQGFANTLRKTVFKNANNEEFAALLVVANEYRLNPLTKEIYAFPQKGGGIVPLVSVDGWIRIMNEHPQFDGIEFEDIIDEKGELYAIEAVIYRKDRSRPIKVTEYLDECRRPTDPWKQSPKRMLRHRALQQACRYAFGFSGIVSEDEVVGEIALGGDLRGFTAPTRGATAAIEHQPGNDQFDPETGEVAEPDEETARELDRNGFAAMEGRADEDHGDQYDGSMADELISRINGAEVIGDVLAIETDFYKDGRALFEIEDQDRIETAIEEARTRFGKPARGAASA